MMEYFKIVNASAVKFLYQMIKSVEAYLPTIQL